MLAKSLDAVRGITEAEYRRLRSTLIDARSDVWSLGMTVLLLLSNKHTYMQQELIFTDNPSFFSTLLGHALDFMDRRFFMPACDCDVGEELTWVLQMMLFPVERRATPRDLLQLQLIHDETQHALSPSQKYVPLKDHHRKVCRMTRRIHHMQRRINRLKQRHVAQQQPPTPQLMVRPIFSASHSFIKFISQPYFHISLLYQSIVLCIGSSGGRGWGA